MAADTSQDAARRKRRARRRRRLVISALVVTSVLTVGWVGVIVGLQKLSGRGGASFREETRQVLEALSAGQSDRVYLEASPRLRERVTRARLADVAEDLRAAFGAFRDIRSIQVLDRIDGPGGRTARVRASLAFEKGRARGQLGFHFVHDQWRLAGIGVSPVEKDGHPVELPGPGEPLAAPPEVVTAVRDILALTGEGDVDTIHELAAPSFRDTISRDELAAVLAMRRGVLGRFVEIREITASHQSRGRTRATVEARATFSKRESTVTMRFHYLADAWRLVSYTVELPRPDIPDVSPDDLLRAEP